MLRAYIESNLAFMRANRNQISTVVEIVRATSVLTSIPIRWRSQSGRSSTQRPVD
jgi:hypothetical protein